MPVLRSRQITSAVKSKTPGKAPEVGGSGPDIAGKAVESLDKNLNVGLGCGAVQRRSARLALKSNLGLTEVTGNFKRSSRKRKELDSGDKESIINGFNLGTPESENQGDTENEDMHFGIKDAGVADDMDVETGNSEGAMETRVKGNEFANLAESGILGGTHDKVESTRNGQRKKKSGTEILLGLEHAGHCEGEGDKGFLNLRCGKKIAKGEAKGDNLHDQIEENIGVNLDCSQQNGTIVEDSRADGSTRNLAEADTIEAENGSLNSGPKFSREEKGKTKALEEDSVTIATGLLELELDFEKANGNTERIDKGKEKLVDHDLSPKTVSLLESKSETRVEAENGNAAPNFSDGTPSHELVEASVSGEMKRRYLQHFRDIAKRNASRFAHFSSQAEEEEDNDFANATGGEIPQPEINRTVEDWPGPFSTAMKIIRDREMNARLQQGKASGKGKAAPVLWVPKKDEKCNIQKKSAPLLQDLCISILVKNSDAITSLDCVPDIMRHKLSHFLCNARRMDGHFLQLLVHGSPTEIRLGDCSWLTEDDFTGAFEQCDFSNLTVLQLDHGGRCLADYILTTTLARSPKSLPALISLSLRGAYRLSDAGLSVLVSSVPALRSINLRECSLLTSDGICYMGASLGSVLKELYLDDCQGIDAMAILPALLKIDNLEVLSLACIETVSDYFIREFSSVRGHNMKELVLANCMKLTDFSVRVIAQTCPKLHAVDFSNLCKLTDAALGYLANGCQAIQNLKLCRNAFSDEAVAAYLQICGEPLKELSLSNIKTVAENAAISLARHSRNLNSLDLSWCRKLTEEALGLIVDSCSSLKVLKVFGCTQITEAFLSGHSNSVVEIIGLKMNGVLEHLDAPDFLKGPLRYSFSSCPV